MMTPTDYVWDFENPYSTCKGKPPQTMWSYFTTNPWFTYG